MPVHGPARVHRDVARVQQAVPVHPAGQRHRRVQGEPRPPVAPGRGGGGRGAEQPAQAAPAVGRRLLQQQPPHPLPLGGGQHHEQGQDPHPFAAHRQGRAHRLAVVLGDPAPLRVGPGQMPGPGELLDGARLLLGGLRPLGATRPGGQVLEGRAGDPPHGLGVGGTVPYLAQDHGTHPGNRGAPGGWFPRIGR